MSQVPHGCDTERTDSLDASEKGSCGTPSGPVSTGSTSPYPYVIKTPRADSKLILQNMEEVLNSVKRKHKQKHRRKKEQKKKALQEAGMVAAENADNTDDSSKHNKKNPKHPLRESKKNVEIAAANLKSPGKNITILDHFGRVTKKDSNGDGSDCVNGLAAVQKPNAFELMMNARNKSIGSNVPGKDLPKDESEETKKEKTVNAKRKMFLQEWADRKGAAKRRLDEDAKDAYIEKTMKQRAKRLKAMLTNGSEEKPETPVSTTPEKPNETDSTKATSSKVQSGRRIKRNSRYTQRYSSDESIELVNINQDSKEFLSKLSSPIKKRDSLLGYFPKKPSPSAEANANNTSSTSEIIVDEITPKRSRRSLRNPLKESKESIPTEPVDESRTSSGRPKRQCAGKFRYDEDRSPSPDMKKTAIRTSNRRSLKEKTPEEEEVIELDNVTSKPVSKKLAPLFVKAVPKPIPSPEVLKAKQEFLMSGVPEKMRLEMIKQKQYEHSYEENIQEFPTVSHVRQLSPDSKMNKTELRPTIRFRKDEDQRTPTRKIKKRAVGAFTTCTTRDFRIQHKNKSEAIIIPPSLPHIDNKRIIIKEWKITYDRFPIYRCYNQLREKYRFFSAIDSGQEAEQVTESFVVTRSSTKRLDSNKQFDPDAEEEKPPPSAPNGELLYSEKYKPLSSDQVLVNVAPVNQLKEFLLSWRGSNRSADVFVHDTSDSSNPSTSSNSVVLLGPTSSGKTNAVFALANEMNFNVLEINAGMWRSGKRLLQDLQEATQSHQIRKDATAKGKSIPKTSINGFRKKKQAMEESSTEFDADQNSRKSLILVEDADIIFEQHDAGFVEAIHTLASTSKRPVIIVASNPRCIHLQRLINQNVIEFFPPNVLNTSKFLSVLSLIENCPTDLNDLTSLYLFNRRQLRKTLLELQFYIQSGGDRPKQKKVLVQDDKTGVQFFASPTKSCLSEENSEVAESATINDVEKTRKKSSENTEIVYHKGLFEFYTVCQNIKHRIPYPVDFALLRINIPEIFRVSRNLMPINSSTRRKSKSPKKAWLTAAKLPPITQTLSDFYENLSTATMIYGERESEDRLVINLSEYIAHSLLESAIDKNLGAAQFAYNLFDSPENGTSLMSYLPATPLRSSRSLCLDYEPVMRSICRSEKTRSSAERRGSRFYHYLRNSFNNCASFSTDLFDSACNVFLESSSQDFPQETLNKQKQ